MKKTKFVPEAPTLTLKFEFPEGAMLPPGAFRDSLFGYGPDPQGWDGKPVVMIGEDVMAVKVWERHVPAVVAMAYTEGLKLVAAGGEDLLTEVVAESASSEEDDFFLIEVRELPSARHKSGRRLGFINGDDFVADTRPDDEVIADPRGDIWLNREEAAQVKHTLIEEHGWTSLVDLEVVAMYNGSEE